MNICLVSVIVPCYNHAQYLDEALQSILHQTHTNWECIIVNDGSKDNTEEVAKKWTLKDNRFRYYYKKNGGLSSTRNFGVQNSKGKFILTLDADDKYGNTFIEKGLAIMNLNLDIGIVSSWGIRFLQNKKFGVFKPSGKSIEDFLFSNAAIGTSFFRKECWEKVGGYDENMKLGYEDWEFYISVCKEGWNCYIIEEILFFYRQHVSSMRTVALKKHDREIKIYIYLKHKELYKDYYDNLINHFLSVIDFEKNNNLKLKDKIDFKLGSILLYPFRIIKSFIGRVNFN